MKETGQNPEIPSNCTAEQKLIVEAVRDFCKKEITPHVRSWEKAQALPRTLFEQLGDLGLMGVLVPQQYGGAGLNYATYTLVLAEVAKADPAVALSLAAHNSLCVGHILAFGTEEQKKRYLPPLCQGKKIGAWALTEAEAGSDPRSLRTKAKLDDTGNWLITGVKQFTTNNQSAAVIVVFARIEETNRIAAFILEKGMPGITHGRKLEKLGMCASETGEVVLQACKVAPTQLIGKTGEGFGQIMHVLEGGRISIAALALGIAQGAYDTALQYAKQRKQFGQVIAKFQAISFKLVDMYMEIRACEALMTDLVSKKDAGEPIRQLVAMTKYYASEKAVRISEESVQILGGYGYTKDFLAEKFYRDAKLCTIGEGTSEIQQLIIAKEICREKLH